MWINDEIELKDKSYEIMEDLNISHMADSYARELSGGQKKLLELARSIINNPETLLLDEPLGKLDAMTREKIRSDIQNFVKILFKNSSIKI